MTQPPFPPAPSPGRPDGPPPAEPFGTPSTAGRAWTAPQPAPQPGQQWAQTTGTLPAPGEADRSGLSYHLVLRGGYAGAGWRGLVGIIGLAVGMVLVLPLVVLLPFLAYYLAVGSDVAEGATRLVDLANPTPAGLAYLNIVLAGLIPITWVLIRFLHGLRPRWLSSVFPRLRWRFLMVCFGLSFLALLATVMVSAALPQDAGNAISGDLNEFTPTIRTFALVVLFLTPLQAAAEEYAFRGYLMQAFGGMFRSPWLAVGASSLLFAAAHGAQDLPVFFDRFAFGLVAGTLVILTGGLEAGIAMHVLNNWLAFGVSLAFGDMGSALNPSGGTWWSIPVTLTQSLTYLALAWWVARRMGLATRTDPAVLAAPRPRV